MDLDCLHVYIYIYSQIVNTFDESFTFAALKEFNNYSVVVLAENEVGHGDFSTMHIHFYNSSSWYMYVCYIPCF